MVRDCTGVDYHSTSTFTFLPKESIMFGIAFGLQSQEITRLPGSLQLALPCVPLPTLIPHLLLRQRFDLTMLQLKILTNNIHSFEQTTLMLQRNSFEATSLERYEYKWNSVGRGLTVFNEALAHTAYVCDIDLRILEFLDGVNR